MLNLLKPRKVILQLLDTTIIFSTNFLLYLIMKSFINLPEFPNVAFYTLVMAFIVYISRVIFSVYKFSWRYANHQEYFKMLVADGLGGMLFLYIQYIIYQNTSVFIYSFIVLTISTLICLISRIIYQVYIQFKTKSHIKTNDELWVGIIGAGMLGSLLAQTLNNTMNNKYVPYCFIDSDKNKIGSFIHGIKVYDSNGDIIKFIKDSPIKELIIAINNINVAEKNNLYELYSKTNLPIRIFDYPYNNKNEYIDIKKQIRDIKIEDLLFRKSIDFSDETMYNYYTDKTILITGGGGSIGSELCRQIAILKPLKLIILDIYENNAYDIQQCLINKYGDALDISVEIASVRDKHKINSIFNKYKPDIVFHAAAHKHVPLMENCSDEAIKNNVFGTYNVVNASEMVGVKKFIIISSDKAVNPTNIMGATKRLCEMIIRSKKDSKTEFIAVRFGNVLGSNGSVIPLFKNQIEKGGPITITDKRIIRYFMTIPEAVQLIMQAGVNAAKSEIYILDMGQPIKILTLAENMIKLSGLRPYIDIDIKEIGLRPGEKLFEELLVNKTLRKTNNEKIFIEEENPISEQFIKEALVKLQSAIETNDNKYIKKVLMEIVPTFSDPDEINKNASLLFDFENINKASV